MKVQDLNFIRDPIMEVYRAKKDVGPYKLTVSLRKEPTVNYAITIQDRNVFVNLDKINPGIEITDFLSEEECNIRLANLDKHVAKL
tara:strand:- start:1090 stop:1347 length:258 start_codon:yes stop_codon:yes gene_type:complete